jgi:hypothetical protein
VKKDWNLSGRQGTNVSACTLLGDLLTEVLESIIDEFASVDRGDPDYLYQVPSQHPISYEQNALPGDGVARTDNFASRRLWKCPVTRTGLPDKE